MRDFYSVFQLKLDRPMSDQRKPPHLVLLLEPTLHFVANAP